MDQLRKYSSSSDDENGSTTNEKMLESIASIDNRSDNCRRAGDWASFVFVDGNNITSTKESPNHVRNLSISL